MTSGPPIAKVASLIGEPARALMLAALLDDRSRTAGELARVSGVTPQTASAHLAKLTQAGLVAVQHQGRHRYHRLASGDVASVLEALMTISSTSAVRCSTLMGLFIPTRMGPIASAPPTRWSNL